MNNEIKTQEDFDKVLFKNIKCNCDCLTIVQFLMDVVRSMLPTEKSIQELANIAAKVKKQRIEIEKQGTEIKNLRIERRTKFPNIFGKNKENDENDQ